MIDPGRERPFPGGVISAAWRHEAHVRRRGTGGAPIRLTSLNHQLGLAERLFPARGRGMVAEWLEQQLSCIDDRDFGERFARHLRLSGHAAADFNHRLVTFEGRRLLGGIRFYAMRDDCPFVEVIAHEFDDLYALRRCVSAEWAGFAPLSARLLVPPAWRGMPDAQVDMTIYAARYADMPASDGRVSLRSFDTPEAAIAMIDERFEALRATDPHLARRVLPADGDDLRAWHAGGTLRAVHGARGQRVGLLAIVPDRIAWIEGDVVQEEIIDVAFSGQGYAASAQRAWSQHSAVDGRRLLLGTIDQRNIASRVTAQRAGRLPVLDYVFLPLQAAFSQSR